ncbi:UDP-N-acetylglucosamine 2-epimerase [Candidatus Magnetobacterium bavaricum]|uniref:UDP-N-acetylglucosamine 2-epimerase (non-hydrolyzing) n=1 Tax=Candidatus Magnetobacterium bavaricum TaxID=29290 RepID=A0A0F3GMU3_9BACT|nr:UDP-N-acetylglucosamine 2-epimerase [Candidatus Magnetobacterium bavaricum]
MLTKLHFVPTPKAKKNLIKEGIDGKDIVVTGNTVIDALTQVLDYPFNMQHSPLSKIKFNGKRAIMVTCHRRETWGGELEEICLAIKDIVAIFPDVIVIYPVHLNPNVRQKVYEILYNLDRIHLLEPLDYLTFVNLMSLSYLILTDSGGVQEEAPTLKKPLLVMRKVTERQEAIEVGASKLVGSNRENIVRELSNLLNDKNAYNSMTDKPNPFGDGKAAIRIMEALKCWFYGNTVLLPEDEEFGFYSVI